jgi:peptidoglycan/xylan/chitin deacetylase (PgdA/CDA1 family)
MNVPAIKKTRIEKTQKLLTFLLVAGMLSLFLSLQRNMTLAAPANLIQNPSVETGGTFPDFWSKGNWGTNTSSFTYPTAGLDGMRAVRIDTTAHADGDAKWVFADVPVSPSTTYSFSDRYVSDVETAYTIRYKNTSGILSYVFLGNVPPASVATNKQFTFTTPSDAAEATVFHIIESVGFLTTDNYALVENTLPSGLITNPSFETAGANGDPENWFRGGWGANTAVFTYPIIGADGGRASQINITNYASGDAKWVFADVPVNSGQIYSFSDSYKSTVPTELVAQFQTPNGFLYTFIASVSASPAWKTVTANITIPVGATSLTVFHSLGANGTLAVDNYSLTPGESTIPPEDLFSRGLVSFSFDDGWITQYVDAFPILNAAGLKGTFYIVSKETLLAVPTERIQNPLLETAGANGDPENWFRGGWGANTAVFTYPVAGIDGGKAAKIDITNYADGDAKWFFKDAAVLPNEEYILSTAYQSTADSVVTIRYMYLDGTVQYADIATIPSSGGAWKNFTQTIAIPANVDTVTVFHLLRGNGSLTVDNYSLKLVPIYVNPGQMLDLQNAGHEIGGHTQTHISLSTVAPGTANSEIIGSRNDLFGMGVAAIDTMAYPYGDYNTAVETMVKNSGYIAARSVDRGFNTKSTNKYELKIQQMDRTTAMSDVQTWVTQAAADKTWLILMFHQEDDNPEHDLGVTPVFFGQVVNYVKTANVDVVTVAQGVSRMNP